MPLKFEKVAVFYNQHKEECRRWAKAIMDYLGQKGRAAEGLVSHGHGKWTESADLVIALGGDGTVLHAARDLAGLDIPLLGVNSGTLGFLSGLEVKDFARKFDDILAGKYAIQKRFLLQAEIWSGGKKTSGPHIAFNDCVIKASEPRAFSLSVRYGGNFLKTYFGDGLIVATPSGSTAYSLAASGPIVYPLLDVYLLTPICPHSLTQRPLVLAAEPEMIITPQHGHGDFTPHPVVSMDGQTNFELKPGDEVRISRSPHKAHLLLPEDYDYFAVLSRKLKWGER